MSNYITKPKPGVMVNPLHPLSRGLVGYWLFNEGAGSLANDISGYKNHGRLKNMLPNVQGSGWSASKFGRGISFDGVNDYVNCGNDASLTGSTSEQTISMRVKKSESGASGSDVDNGIYVIWGKVAITHVAGSVRLKYWIGTNDYIFNPPTSITHEEFDQLTLVRNNTGWKTYKNGVYIGENSDQSGALDAGISDVYLGRFSWEYGNFKALFDKVLVYNRALSASEVKMLYEQPFCNLMK